MRACVKLSFPSPLIGEPVIADLARRFGDLPDVRRARITESVAEMVLELTGTRESLGEGIQSLRERGVEVELVGGDMVEC